MNALQLISLVLSVGSSLLPIIIGFKRRRTLVWALVFTGFAFDIGLIIAKRVFHLNIFPMANLYVLVEFALITLYYYYAIAKNSKLFLPVTAILALIYVVQTTTNGMENRNGSGASIFYGVYLLYALWGFYYISAKKIYTNLTGSMFFWVNVAMLLGSSGRFILFLFEDYLISHNDAHLGELWLVYRLFNICVNIIFAVALSRKYE